MHKRVANEPICQADSSGIIIDHQLEAVLEYRIYGNYSKDIKSKATNQIVSDIMVQEARESWCDGLTVSLHRNF